MPCVRSTMPSWRSLVPNQRPHESCVTAILGATAASGRISSIFLPIPARARQQRVLPSPPQALPLLTKSQASFGRMVVKILKVPNTSTSTTQRSTQFSSKTPWAIASKFAITAWINSSEDGAFAPAASIEVSCLAMRIRRSARGPRSCGPRRLWRSRAERYDSRAKRRAGKANSRANDALKEKEDEETDDRRLDLSWFVCVWQAVGIRASGKRSNHRASAHPCARSGRDSRLATPCFGIAC